MGRIAPGITADSSNKRRGGGEDEGMRLYRKMEMDGALHEVRLAKQGTEKRERNRERAVRMLREDKLPSLLLSDKLINQRDDWQPLNHSSGIGSGSASPNYGRVSHKPLTLLLVSSSVKGFLFSFTEQKKKKKNMLEVLILSRFLLFPPSAIRRNSRSLKLCWPVGRTAPPLSLQSSSGDLFCVLCSAEAGGSSLQQ